MLNVYSNEKLLNKQIATLNHHHYKNNQYSMNVCLFGARHGAKAFSHLMLISMKEVLLLLLFYIWANWTIEHFSDLSKSNKL